MSDQLELSFDQNISDEEMAKLPAIKILSMTDEPYCKMDLDIDDKAYDLFVEEGKRLATDDDYFNLGFHKVLEKSVEKKES